MTRANDSLTSTGFPRASWRGGRRNCVGIRQLSGARRTFDGLHDVLDDGRVAGIGELTVYDTATRIGAFRKLYPTRVYVHAGVRDGIRAFHLANRYWVRMSELPRPFRRLTPGETEDCLCIYKRQIKAIVRKSSAVARAPTKRC